MLGGKKKKTHRNGSSSEEAYKLLQMRLESATQLGFLKVISFTSVEQCEEKWAYVSSIAKIIAREGRKILVVDCNIDNFRIKKYFGMELEGILDELIQHNGKNIFEASGTPNLHFIPKGLGLSDLDGNLDFEKIVKLIEKAREEYDLILIDSPIKSHTLNIINIEAEKKQGNEAKSGKDNWQPPDPLNKNTT
ncbi:MAG TPA: CpsD/CapB family tyrosine-protein kinase [Clostridiaceae bacterium]|nr:CpsD/CapB family tyrosine-protein kinase [Clostridiaceae bacterium]